MNKYFQIAFFVMLVSGLMILYARLGLRDQFLCASDSHFLKVGLLGLCVFFVGYGFIIAGLIMGKEE